MNGITPVARKALSLERDGVFRLLVVMTALLGWVVALGVGGSLMMHGLYKVWRLERSQMVQVYLQPDTDAAALQAAQVEITRVPGVGNVEIVPPDQLMALLAPYGGDMSGLPLPQVLEIRTGEAFDRSLLDPVIQARFPAAEIDDAKPVLQAVARGVSVVQLVGVGLAAVMLMVMGLLVTLTVRAGLRAQRSTLELLQHIGATHKLVQKLVSQQVVERVALGWAWASAGAVAVTLVSVLLWPTLQAYVGWPIWISLAVAPALLPAVAWLTARVVVGRLLQPALAEQGA
ncbi:MAG: hypothetical protein WAZ18_04360 [Alphaproteobacteria bacterium]